MAILPTKHLDEDRALISIGAEILTGLEEPRTFSSLWEEYNHQSRKPDETKVDYEWFVLSLEFLYSINAIEYRSGLLSKVRP